MKKSHYIVTGIVTVVVLLIALPFVLTGSQRSVRDMFNAPRLWVPETFQARQEFARFVKQFKAQEAIFISWPGCTIDDPRLKQLATALREPDSKQKQRRHDELFSQVLSGYETYRDLLYDNRELSRVDVLKRLKGTFVGPDGKTSCCIIFLTPQGAIDRDEALAIVTDAAQRELQLDMDELRIAGPPIDGIAVDQESVRSIERYAIPSAIISFILCWICLRSFWLTLPIIAIAAFSEGLMLASVGFIGAKMNAILIVLPPLVYVLSVSSGVHLVNYYLDATSRVPLDSATNDALSKGWLPCFLASATTAIGLGSLLVSDVEPVRQFGTLAAVGVMLSLLLLFTLLPGAMELRPILISRFRGSTSPGRSVEHEEPTWVERAWDGLAETIGRYRIVVSLASLALMVVAGCGLLSVHTSVSGVNLLVPDNRYVKDFRWFEKNVGPLIPVEVILRMPVKNDALDTLERMEIVQDVQEAMSGIENVDGVVSLATFIPPIPPPGGLRQTLRRTVIRRLLDERKQRYVDAGYLHEQDGEQSWRVSGRVLAQDDVDYADFLDQIESRIEPVVDMHRSHSDAEIAITYTGVTPVVDEANRALLSDLFRSFMTALGLVTIVMIVVLKSVRAGLVAMIPNIFPATMLFGLMGWADISVDIGSVMTASVALGIAVDGTLHFLNWFRREVSTGSLPVEAVSRSYRHCGRALAQTTLICACGLLIYTLSGFVPARNFSWMMLLMLMVAMIGDLIVLPAILVGPLGSWFVSKTPEHDPKPQHVGAS